MSTVVITVLLFVVIYAGIKLQRVRRQLILCLLQSSPEGLRGAEIVELSRREVPPGLVYAILHGLEADGLVVSQVVEVMKFGELELPRRRYRLVPAARMEFGQGEKQ